MEGTFVWSDNSTWNFSNWSYGEPNDIRTGQDCGQIYIDVFWTKVSKWGDDMCVKKNNLVCKKYQF